jgi:AraC-like DNA-binding protein
MDEEMGVAYERSLRFEKAMHIHDRVLFVFPREGTSMRVRIEAPAASFVVSSREALIVPAGLRHDDAWVTDVYDTLALLPSAALVARIAASLDTPVDVFGQAIRFARSSWLDALLGEYFAERVLRVTTSGARHRSLETLIVIEVLRLATEVASDRELTRERPGPSSVVARALRHIEAYLFAELDLANLCRVCGTSRSSLLRHFRAEVGATPKAYLLGRRLDEAKRLLEGGRYAVSEVAHLVGYAHAGAFGEAFRRRFHVAPSALTSAR